MKRPDSATQGGNPWAARSADTKAIRKSPASDYRKPSPPAQEALPVTIAKFWRNRHRKESVVLQLREYEGMPLVDLRIHETGSDGIDRPTTKGLALSIKRLPALADAFTAANREAHRLGLFGATERSS